MQVMTWQFTVIIVISIGTVITAIMHTDEFKKTDAVILAMVLKVMGKQCWDPQQLAHFGSTEQVDHDQYDNQGLFHS